MRLISNSTLMELPVVVPNAKSFPENPLTTMTFVRSGGGGGGGCFSVGQ